MGTTTRGIVYPDPSTPPRRQNLVDLATSADSAIGASVGMTPTTYAPALGGVTLGNGSLSGRYIQVGLMIDYSITLTFGSSTTVSGNIVLGVPVASRGGYLNRPPFGDATLFKLSTGGSRHWKVIGSGAGSVSLVVIIEPNNSAIASSAAPWAWAAGDTIEVSGRYEKAP